MLFILILFGLATGLEAGQRLPPGINPKRYQLPEHIHPAENQQQLPAQNHQHPAQNHQHPVLNQQQQEFSHNHESTLKFLKESKNQKENLAQKIVTTGNIQQERSHIQEHMPVPLDTNHMTDAELQFHYFKMHDSDGNNKLDGCEIYKALIHLHDADPNNTVNNVLKTLTDEELAALIDPLLEMDDTSRDGYIDYPEFIKARNKKP